MLSVLHLQFYETPFSESQFMEIGILGGQGVTVLLTAPLWPIMPTTSPGSMLKLTSSSDLNGARSTIG